MGEQHGVDDALDVGQVLYLPRLKSRLPLGGAQGGECLSAHPAAQVADGRVG